MATVNIGIVVSATNRAGGAIAAARRDVDGLGTSLRRIAQVMRAVQALFLVNQIVSWARALFNATKELQGLQLRLAAVSGSMQKANQIFAELNAKYGPAGLDVAVLADGFVRLAGAGLTLEKTRETIDALANATAAFGGTGQELSRAVIGISQVAGKGTLQMEEMKQQIGEAVPVAMRIMADAAGVSVGRFVDMVTKGMIDSDRAVQLFIDGSKKAFGNYTELLKSTLGGAFGRINAEFQAGLQKILANTTFDEGLVAIFNTIADGVKNFMASIDQSAVDRFFDTLQKLYETFVLLWPAIYAVVQVIGLVASAILNVVSALPEWVVVGGGLLAMFFLGGPIGAAAAILAGVLYVIDQIGVTLQQAYQGWASVLPKGLLYVFTLGSSEGDSVVTFIVRAIQGVFQALLDAAAYALSFVSEATAQQIRQIRTALDDRVDQLVAVQKAAEKANEAQNSLFSYTSKDASGRSGDVTYYGAEAIKRIMADNAKLAGSVKVPKGIIDGFKQGGDAAARLADKLARVRKDIEDTITQITNKIDILEKELSGDELGLALDKVKKQYDDITIKITDQIQKAEQLNKKTGDQKENIAALNDLLERGNAARAIAVQQATQLVELSRQEFFNEQEITRLKLDQQIADAKRAADSSIAGNLFADTEGGRAVLEILRQEHELKVQIKEVDQQILDIQKQQIGLDEVKRAELDLTIEKLRELQAVQQKTLEDLSVGAQLSGQLWRDVGSAISTSVGSALKDLAKGTFDLNKLMLSLWESITNAVIKYIQKLIEAQIQALILKTITGGTGGGSFLDAGTSAAAFAGFAANGAVVPGGVQMFANGGIISGPTMFGMAGEAGTEAIMPLTRIGGKLGVQTTGSVRGGDLIVHLNAIDTQTGVEFLMKHISQLQAMLQQRHMLNRGMGVY